MLVVEYVEFFKAIVVKPDIFGSKIVDEKHFQTKEDAERFKLDIMQSRNDLLCVVCKM